jgi:hypothetical protein
MTWFRIHLCLTRKTDVASLDASVLVHPQALVAARMFPHSGNSGLAHIHTSVTWFRIHLSV